MAPRIHIDHPLQPGAELVLPPNASRHAQVLRLQPGAALTLFDGQGGEWAAEVLAMGRKEVSARLLQHHAIERELALPVTLALGMPANERMDSLVEKATELGVATIQPLVCERSVLRLAGERAQRKTAHWQAVASAACEQCGRNRLPVVAEPVALRDWLAGQGQAPASASARWMLSLADEALPLAQRLAQWASASAAVIFLSGPEGGLSPAEQALALALDFAPVSLGRRVLRADTAPLAALAALALLDRTEPKDLLA